MVDLLDKDIMEVIDNRKRSLKYHITDKVLGQHLARLQEEGYLESEKGRWHLTSKGKMLLENFWGTLSQLKIGEETSPKMVEAPQIEEAMVASHTLTPTKLAKSLKGLGTKRQQATEFILLVFTGVMFSVTGLLLLAKVYNLFSIIILGLNAWVLTLAVGVVSFIITGINVSFR